MCDGRPGRLAQLKAGDSEEGRCDNLERPASGARLRSAGRHGRHARSRAPSGKHAGRAQSDQRAAKELCGEDSEARPTSRTARHESWNGTGFTRFAPIHRNLCTSLTPCQAGGQAFKLVPSPPCQALQAESRRQRAQSHQNRYQGFHSFGPRWAEFKA